MSGRSVRRQVGVALAILLALGTAALAQVRDAGLRGSVRYDDGTPTPARILLGYEGRYYAYATLTRDDQPAGYEILRLAPGRYEFVVSATRGKPFRYWGVELSSQQVRTLNLLLPIARERRETVEMIEVGKPTRADAPRRWKGAWLEGLALREDQFPADGSAGLFRNFRRLATLAIGNAPLPGYFQHRDLTPGVFDLVVEPPLDSGYRKARLRGIELREFCRTRVGPIVLPAGDPRDPPVDVAVTPRYDELR